VLCRVYQLSSREVFAALSERKNSCSSVSAQSIYFFFVGSFLRLVFARSRSCFSDIDSAIFFEGPFRLDFFCSPRLAAKAAPAAFCCFFERAGIPLYRFAPEGWSHSSLSQLNAREAL
jgi:hypothetical protein